MLVTLTPKEMSKCNQAATLRWQLARASGVSNQRRDKGRSDADLDLLGVKAELMLRPRFTRAGVYYSRKGVRSKLTALSWFAKSAQTSLMLQATHPKRRFWKSQKNLI